MERLPDEQRTVLVLVCADGLSYEEAAEVMGCEIGTIKSRLNRGRRTLETLLNSSGPQQMPRRTAVHSMPPDIGLESDLKPSRACRTTALAQTPRMARPHSLPKHRHAEQAGRHAGTVHTA